MTSGSEPEPIALTEVGTETVVLSLDDSQVAALQAAELVNVQPAAGGLWTLRAGRKVGAIRIGNLEIEVTPKVGVANLLFFSAMPRTRDSGPRTWPACQPPVCGRRWRRRWSARPGRRWPRVRCADTLPSTTHCRSNPKFYELQRLRKSTWDTPRFVRGYDITLDDRLLLPRGLRHTVRSIVERAGARLALTDVRNPGNEIDVEFTATLKSDQAIAVSAILAHDDGVLVAPPGSGKTVMACAIIAERATSTLVLVDRKAWPSSGAIKSPSSSTSRRARSAADDVGSPASWTSPCSQLSPVTTTSRS